MELSYVASEAWQERTPADATEVTGGAARSPGEGASAPALARRFKFLTEEGQAATPLEQEALLGTNDLVEASFLDRLVMVSRCVGRLRFQTPRGRSYATGFLIAPNLLMTNHHVFPAPSAAQGATVAFDYKYDLAGQLPAGEEYDLDPGAFHVSNPDLDFAVVAVAPRSTGGAELARRGYLRLNAETGKTRKGEFVTIVQYPDGDPMRIALRENEITRLEADEPVMWYRADTAHGSSGSPVFNDSFQIVALHASGRIKRDEHSRFARRDGNWAETLEGLGEGDVIWEANVGMRVSRICARLLPLAEARSPAHRAVIEAAMAGGDVLAAAVDVRRERAAAAAAEESFIDEEGVMANEKGPGVGSATRQGGDVLIPLTLRVSLEAAGGVATVAAPRQARSPADTAKLEAEAFRFQIPIIHDGLATRGGFQRRFLDDANLVPMPVLTDDGKAIAAPVIGAADDDRELRYHKFSVWMHRERRLPLFTASNVNWMARKKEIGGVKINRDSLAGFPPDGSTSEIILEQWVTDARIAAAHQLPDVFYSEDGGAFDKGHVVRRDDVAWGETFDDIQKGNGDTYHVTNCTPQIKGFNQSKHGENNWGDLEDVVQRVAKAEKEKLVIYAGPVFRAKDRWFRGRDDFGSVRVQVPRQYWKIVVAPGPKAYGFVLGQDVTGITEAEFAVPAEFKSALRRVSEIEDLLRGWIDLTDLKAVDQFDVVMAGG